jgi:AcrR family transcriptional regulator
VTDLVRWDGETQSVVSSRVMGSAARASSERICDAALACVARWGVAKTTLEDVAREAGVGRATIYRVFRGGKAEVLRAMAAREVARFIGVVEREVSAAGDDLEDVVVAGVTAAARQLTDHEALAFLLAHEPDAVLPHVGLHRRGDAFECVRDFVDPHLARFLPDEEHRARAAEWLARVVLMYVFTPAQGVDLAEPESARRLVRGFVLPGLLAGSPAT